jgi:hypothetical protein
VPLILARSWPVWQAAAGRLIEGPGILFGLLRPPVISLANFFNIFVIKYYVFGFFKADRLAFVTGCSFQHFFQDVDLVLSAVVLV